jgi:hypothetical protein
MGDAIGRDLSARSTLLRVRHAGDRPDWDVLVVPEKLAELGAS